MGASGRRIAFMGASGTGKSTLALHVAKKYNLPLNPVGSRSVAADMGFASPYDVDAAGLRAEFQRRLLRAKMEWEEAHDDFVTDRTTYDNLAYTMLHDVRSITASDLAMYRRGCDRYTRVILCPVGAFINIGGDPARVADMTYHVLFETVLLGLLNEVTCAQSSLWALGLDRRKAAVERWVETETP